MIEQALVTVVVPTYYRNERLQSAIQSAYAQAWPVEVVVVDGSGEAHARPVVESFADRDPIYVPQADDEGPHAARSVGAGYADGEYVQFLDDDDRLLPGKFAAQVPLFSEDVGVVYSGLIDEEWGYCEPRSAVEGDVLREALELRTFPAIPSTMLIERGLVEELRPFEHRHGADDSGAKIELARRTEFAAVDEPLVYRGKPAESLSSSWDHVRGRRYLLERYDHLYDQFPDSVRRTALRWTHYRAGNKHLEESAWSPKAIASFARAAYHAPRDRTEFTAAAVAALFGRPGLEGAERLTSLP